jgi:hypothetical protein
MGLMRSYFLVNPRTKELAALGELIDFARRFDSRKVNELMKAGGTRIYSKGQKQKDFIIALYDKIIQPNISSAMPSQDITLKMNHLEYLKRDEVVRVGGALNLMHKTIDYEGKGVVNLRRMVIMDIQAGLAPAAARFAERLLNENPHRKVVIFYQFNEARDILLKQLKKYKPLLIAGTQHTSYEEREDALKKFNAPNDKYRVLIASILVASLGIQMDDKIGGFPRRSIILPVWSLKNMMQAADRIGRADTVWGGSKDPAERDAEADDRPRAYFFYAANATGPNPDDDTMIKLMKKAIEKGKMLGVSMRGEKGEIPLLPDSFQTDYQKPPEDTDMYPPLNSELNRVLREEAEKKSQILFADILEGRAVEVEGEEEDFGEPESEGEEEVPKSKKAAARKKAAASKSRSRSTQKKDIESEEEESEEEPKPKAKKSAAKASTKKATAKSRSRSAAKVEEEGESTEEDEGLKPKPKPPAPTEVKTKTPAKPSATGKAGAGKSEKPTAPATSTAKAAPTAPVVTGGASLKRQV